VFVVAGFRYRNHKYWLVLQPEHRGSLMNTRNQVGGRSGLSPVPIPARVPADLIDPIDFDGLQSMIDGLAELVALVSFDGTIEMTNSNWQQAVERQQAWGFRVGGHYPIALRDLIAAGDVRLLPILNNFLELCGNKRQSFRSVYFGAGILSGRDYNMRFSRLEFGGKDYVLISAADLTEINALKRERRRLGSRILRAQDDERLRIAREIHDSTSQLLVALELDLSTLERELDPHSPVITDCKTLVRDVHRQIRSLSFIAHPPSLPENGLQKALEALVTGFASRTGLQIELQMSDVGTASESIEWAMYRLAQEALANVHRHASASQARVGLVGTMRCLHLIIFDDGIGFDTEADHGMRSLGVGVPGMAGRVRELGGRFSMHRASDGGTIVRASLPRCKRDL